MSKLANAITAAAAVLACGLTNIAAYAQEYDKTFLNYASKPTVTSILNGRGTNVLYVARSAFSRLAEYDAVIVDLPEVLISAKSEYKGAAPVDLYSMSAFMREHIIDAITSDGYYVVDPPDEGVLYLSLAISDLKLKKKKRGLLAYTAAAYPMKAGIDATRLTMEKYDIMGLTFQAEITDSVTGKVVASLVALRSSTGQRMEFKEFNEDVQSFASRLLCRLDNSRGPEEKDIDCRSQAVHQAAEHHHNVAH
jgi:hypothetical protein